MLLLSSWVQWLTGYSKLQYIYTYLNMVLQIRDKLEIAFLIADISIGLDKQR